MKKQFSKRDISKLANQLGFDDCKFTRAKLPAKTGAYLEFFIDAGYHGDMNWIEESFERRSSPENMWNDAKTAIVLAMNYGPENDPLEIINHQDKAAISVYAQNRDYHDLIKGRLKQIAQTISSRNQCQVKVFVDTAPLMEKPLAHQSGVGWQGKHTNLVSKNHGSWLFLGVILTDQIMEEDPPEKDHCGSCRACLDICPTNAFPTSYQLDARRCISYLTIEYSGPIPLEFRRAMGNRIYGCDDCLAICPWNKFAKKTSEMKLKARADLNRPLLSDLVRLDDGEFRKYFSGSPVKRIGRDRFIRNVLIAIGNSKSNELSNVITMHLEDSSPIVRGACIWALSNLLKEVEFKKLRNIHQKNETDPTVNSEWDLTG